MFSAFNVIRRHRQAVRSIQNSTAYFREQARSHSFHLATPFLVFFSFLDSTISGHVTQISGFLRCRKIKVTDFSKVAEFWKVLINFHKVMIIIRFYAN